MSISTATTKPSQNFKGMNFYECILPYENGTTCIIITNHSLSYVVKAIAARYCRVSKFEHLSSNMFDEEMKLAEDFDYIIEII